MVSQGHERGVRRAVLASVAALLVATLAACNGDDAAAPSTPPLPTLPESTSDTAGPTTTSDTTDPESASTTSELNPTPPTPVITTGPPVATSSPTITAELPPVSTLVPEVPAELLLPEQADPSSPNNDRTILPEHVPVIEAHLQSLQASNLVGSTWPINPDAPELLAAPYLPEFLSLAQQDLRERLARGEVLNVSQGITFRPYILGPVTDVAVVLDCEFAGHYWTKAETGELVPPNEIWPAGPGRIVEVGLREVYVLRDGQWLLSQSLIDPSACA